MSSSTPSAYTPLCMTAGCDRPADPRYAIRIRLPSGSPGTLDYCSREHQAIGEVFLQRLEQDGIAKRDEPTVGSHEA